MRIAVFSSKNYDRQFLEAANRNAAHHLNFIEARLTPETAKLAHGHGAVCVFVNDIVNAKVIEILRSEGVRLVALRCAGFNNVDLAAASAAGLAVCRVPAYSPYAIAEHTAAMVLALNRKIVRASNRVREGNFELDGLLGFDLHGRTVGIVGTGKIGRLVARIFGGFGCRVIAADPVPIPGAAFSYVSLEELWRTSDIISLHCPLTPETHHLVSAQAIAAMKPGVMIINTSRGAVVDTVSVIRGLKSGHIGSLGLDVYEEEADLFFEDLSGRAIDDDVFARLLTFPNVLITGHQAFFTREALTNIAAVTMDNMTAFEKTGAVLHPVTVDMIAPAPPAPA